MDDKEKIILLEKASSALSDILRHLSHHSYWEVHDAYFAIEGEIDDIVEGGNDKSL